MCRNFDPTFSTMYMLPEYNPLYALHIVDIKHRDSKCVGILCTSLVLLNSLVTTVE
jgi:hypothetical protein